MDLRKETVLSSPLLVRLREEIVKGRKATKGKKPTVKQIITGQPLKRSKLSFPLLEYSNPPFHYYTWTWGDSNTQRCQKRFEVVQLFGKVVWSGTSSFLVGRRTPRDLVLEMIGFLEVAEEICEIPLWLDIPLTEPFKHPDWPDWKLGYWGGLQAARFSPAVLLDIFHGEGEIHWRNSQLCYITTQGSLTSL